MLCYKLKVISMHGKRDMPSMRCVVCVPSCQVEPALAHIDYVQHCCEAGVRVFLFQVFTEADLGALGVSSTGAIQHGWLWEVVHCSAEHVGITHWNKSAHRASSAASPRCTSRQDPLARLLEPVKP